MKVARSVRRGVVGKVPLRQLACFLPYTMHETNLLKAGAAMIDITPPAGTHLAGSGAGEHRPAQAVMDPLFAKAIVFESGGQRVCMVILDLTIVTGSYTDKVRAAIGEQTGLAPEAIMVQATQTHSAPSLGYFMLDPDFPLETTDETEYLRGAERAYGDRAAAAAVEAAVKAVGKLQPVRIGLGRGVLGDLAFNRRGIRRDGTIAMPKPLGREQQPFGIADICYLEGPMDPEVGVCCVQDMDMNPLAFLLHYTCHPVNAFGYPETYRAVSADWPGAWARQMQQLFGSDAVPLVVNGCCGNINPWHPFDPDCRPDHQRMGRELAQMSERIVHNMAFANDAALDCKIEKVGLPLRDIPAERLREVNAILAENPQPPRGVNGEVDPHWFRAASTHSVELCRQRDGEFPYEIQAFRIGDLGVIGLPGEPFVEGQLALKTNSAAPFLFPAHLTTHYVGYLPTRAAYARGGHEANEDVTYWAKLAPGSLETVVGQARTLVEELFDGRHHRSTSDLEETHNKKDLEHPLNQPHLNVNQRVALIHKKKLRKPGETQEQLANRFGLKRSLIGQFNAALNKLPLNLRPAVIDAVYERRLEISTLYQKYLQEPNPVEAVKEAIDYQR